MIYKQNQASLFAASKVTSEVVKVTEVNYLEVTEKFITHVVVPKNGSFHDLLAKSTCFTCGLK